MTHPHWDAAFDNMGHIPDSAELPAFWAARAEDYRIRLASEHQRLDTNIQYGKHEREVFDIVWPECEPKGLVVFIHGGYWIRLDKSYWTDLAEGARANGWAVCIPSYTLAPQARISDITNQIGKAITTAAQRVDGPIRLTGHSAGGHLVTRMLCDTKTLPSNILDRVVHTVSISGIHDLRPLLHTQMNLSLQLTESEAIAESPALLRPKEQASVIAWVGGGERPEFIRQAQLLNLIWRGLDASITCNVDLDHNHFTVIEGLKDPASEITKAILATNSA